MKSDTIFALGWRAHELFLLAIIIFVTCPTISLSQNTIYLSAEGHQFAINDIVTASVNGGTEFAPLENILGVGFQILFDSEMLQFEEISIENSSLGQLNELIRFENELPDGSGIAISLSRTHPSGHINISGSILNVQFTAIGNGSTSIQIIGIETSDAEGNLRNYPNTSLEIQIGDSAIDLIGVWPGDTNNDGIVDHRDILPIGYHYGKVGFARESTNRMAWLEHLVLPWPNASETFADANGDGVIDYEDLYVIDAYAGRTTPLYDTHSDPEIKHVAVEIPSDASTLLLEISINRPENVTTFMGLTFRLHLPAFAFDCSAFYESAAYVMSNIGHIYINDLPTLSLSAVNENCSELTIAFTLMGWENALDFDEVKVAIVLENTAGISGQINIPISDYALTTNFGSTEDFPISIVVIPTTSSSKDYEVVGNEPTLLRNYPNPFNPETTIELFLIEGDYITLDIFDATGRHLKTLVETYKDAGTHRIKLDATTLASGLYLYRLSTTKYQITQKMTILK